MKIEILPKSGFWNICMLIKEPLSNIKLRLYQVGLSIACVVLGALYWRTSQWGPLDAEERFIIPVALAFCGVSLILFRIYKQRYVAVFDLTVCLLVFAYDWLHYMAGLREARLEGAPLDFSRFLIWLPILYAIFFLCFPIRQATLASAVFVLSLGIPAVYHLWQVQERETFSEDFSMLLGIFSSGIVFTLIFFTLSSLKERYAEVVSMARALKIRADADHLTEVYSRAKIFDILDSHLANARLTGQPFSIMVVDMDNLKSINDRYGHDIGDQALKQVAHAIRNTSRRSDSVGRIGGDEFLLICGETGAEEIGKLGERLQRVIADSHIVSDTLSISCGAAVWQLSDTAESLFRRADQAMYEDKNRKKLSSGHV